MAVEDDSCDEKYEKRLEVVTSEKKVQDVSTPTQLEHEEDYHSPYSLAESILKLRGGADCPAREFGFKIIQKNARSLSTDERLTEALGELDDAKWDAVIFNETWRVENAEDFLLESGHRWLGSGGAKRNGGAGGKHGVAILLHRRWAWAVSQVKPISPRLMFVDIRVRRHKIRLISVYMPHVGYGNDAVDDVYKAMEHSVNGARSERRLVIIGGDWNAEVGKKHSTGEETSVGNHGHGKRNPRGHWLADWQADTAFVFVALGSGNVRNTNGHMCSTAGNE